MGRKKSELALDGITLYRQDYVDAIADVLLCRLRRFPAVVKFRENHMGSALPSKRLMKNWQPTPDAAAALATLSRHMGEAFNISEADARAAILGNVRPQVRLVAVANSLKTGAGCSATTTIHIEASALATPDEVAAAFNHARRQLLRLGSKARVKPPQDRAIALTRFAARYNDAEGEAGRVRWNKQHPNHPAPLGMNTWRRDVRRAVAQVADPAWLETAVDSAFVGGLGKHRLDG